MSRISADEARAYGSDLIDVVQRDALDKIEPHLVALQSENQHLKRRVHAAEARDIYATLDASLGNWREINTSAAFLHFLSFADVYSGRLRSELLRQAFAAADAQRVLAIFQDFLQQAQSSAAPARTARSPRGSSEKPTFTSADVTRFYAEGRGRTFTPEQQKRRDALEHQIIAAGAEGRILR